MILTPKRNSGKPSTLSFIYKVSPDRTVTDANLYGEGRERQTDRGRGRSNHLTLRVIQKRKAYSENSELIQVPEVRGHEGEEREMNTEI